MPTLCWSKEVYRDQVKSTEMILDDDFIDHMWELTMEDNFLGLLTLEYNLKKLTVRKLSKQELEDEGFSETKSVRTKGIADFLMKIPELENVATRLYHYFKYFSQYEHFSENGQCDVLASSEKDGNDNIHLPSAIRVLSSVLWATYSIFSHLNTSMSTSPSLGKTLP